MANERLAVGQNAADAPQPLIALRGIARRFGANRALDGIDLEVVRGDSLVLIGESGSGKSLILKCIVGLVAPDRGSIEIDGRAVAEMSGAERRHFEGRFGMLFQRSGLFDSLPVWQNVAFRMLQRGIRGSKARERADEVLAAVGLEPAVGDLYPAEISGGMQKRVGFARAIVDEPEMLFLDEPTAGLDPIMTNVVEQIILDNVQKLGATTIVITSNMDSAKEISNRIAMVHRGKIVWHGPTADVERSGNDLVDRFVTSGMAHPFQHSPSALDDGRVARP